MARRHSLPLLGVLVATLIAAPAAAQTVANPELFEKSLDAAQQALRHYGEYHDAAALRRMADVGYQVAAQSQFTKAPFTFFLVDMPEPNAFALPGGQVFLTRGMVELGLTDDMLAALLGHEIAHVALQHGVRMQRRATLLNVLSQAALIGVLVGAAGSSGDAAADDPFGSTDNRQGDLVQGTAAAGLVVSELLLRSYSREFEHQADDEGQRWAAAAGFDPDGTRQLMTLMGSRLPQDKQYGYWQTHPFFDTRVDAAKARGVLLKAQTPRPADELRNRTQAALLTYLEGVKTKPRRPLPVEPPAEERRPAGRPGAEAPRPPAPDLELEPLLERAALVAWPQGPAAESLRLRRIHTLRERELAKTPLARDYGALLAAYGAQSEEVKAVTPQSPLLQTLAKDSAELRAQARDLYPQAQEVLRGGVYETAFLEVFASNWPESPEMPQAALALGDAYSRLGRQADAVAQYVRALEAAPASPAGERARAGLRNLAPVIVELAALQPLVDQKEDPELVKIADARLAKLAVTYDQLPNGAEYLRRYPEGPYAPAIALRLNAIAHDLYGEMVLYQSVGDSLKAMQRIQQILTYAPTSPAADRLRELTVVEG